MRTLTVSLLLTAPLLAQTTAAPQQSPADAPARYTVPAGTHVLMALQSPISTKNALPGAPVYAQTTFPVALDNRNLIPAGSYVQGVVDRVQRAPRGHGRAQLQVHFTTLILANGYTVSLPGSLSNAPENENDKVGKEGNVQGGGRTGKDLSTVATTTLGGAELGTLGGALAGSVAKGAAIGGGVGLVAGIVTKLVSRGPDIRFDVGTPVEMVLQRPLVLEDQRLSNAQLQPVQTLRVLEKQNKPYVPRVVPGTENLPTVPR